MRLIDADALKECAYEFDDVLYDGSMVVDVGDIDDAPTIDPVKHGHWIEVPDRLFYMVRCSECGHVSKSENDYCQHCGAKMKDEDGASE